jgi:hypothetical protein
VLVRTIEIAGIPADFRRKSRNSGDFPAIFFPDFPPEFFDTFFFGNSGFFPDF